MRKIGLIFFTAVISINLFAEAPTYWDEVKKNDIKMTDEEYIANVSMVLRPNVWIRFIAQEELDGIHYGKISTGEKGIDGRLDNPKVSDKRITNGLYDNKYPMVKSETGRNDIKWFWYPATNSYHCIFFKFSLGGSISKWLPLGHISGTYYRLDWITDFSCKNIDANSFKLEGIRIVYNCDYKILANNANETLAFVNDDKSHASKIVASGAKIMDLDNAIFNSLEFFWINNENEKEGLDKLIISKDPVEEIHFYSDDKINFMDKVEQARIQKEKEENEKQKNELMEFIRDKEEFYVKNKCLPTGWNFTQIGNNINGIDVYCIIYENKTPISFENIDNYYNSKREYANRLKDQYGIENFEKVVNYIVLNYWSKRDGFSPVYSILNTETSELELEEEIFLKHLGEINVNINSNGYRFPSENDFKVMAKNKKKLQFFQSFPSEIFSNPKWKKYFIVRTNNN